MKRRQFLLYGARGACLSACPGWALAQEDARLMESDSAIRLFLAGDFMCGRGIDQILPHPSKPTLYESYVRSAITYLELAEEVNGPIARGVDYAYLWGDALAQLQQMAPELRIINLETAVTRSDDYWRGKGINYRMQPKNLPAITAAAIDCCVLANNHVLDWGYAGLAETLSSLSRAGIATAGAGSDLAEAAAPAVMEVAAKGRVLLFAYGDGSSGVSSAWAAAKGRAGVNRLQGLTEAEAGRIAAEVAALKGERDVVVLSLHWGGNWGYPIPPPQRDFAHRLIDEAGVDIVYGHSSHHPRGIEVYRERLILYGCGDLLNDYEGIGGHDAYRDDLSLMYFPDIDPASGRLLGLTLLPQQIKHFRLNRVTAKDARWLEAMLNREGEQFGTGVAPDVEGRLKLRW